MIVIQGVNNNSSSKYLPRWMASQLKAMAREARVKLIL